MMIKRILRLLILPVLASLFVMGGANAYAAESATARIPVYARGADCTAVLTDQGGTILQTLPLKDGVVGYFDVLCDGLGSHKYTIKLSDTDTGMFVYDKTVYTVDVELFYDENFAIFYTITADPIGTMHRETGDGKPEKLEFVNTHAWQPCYVDPPVQKNITGNPPVTSVFTFTMEANDAAFPMPAGSVGGVKTVSIAGRGAVEFGIITFTEPGVYEYTITERNNRALWYTYDTAVYTLRFTVTDVDGQLESTCTVFKNGTEEKDATSAVFTNTYSIFKTPKTGEDSDAGLWLTISLISLCALAVTIFLRRRQCKTAEDADWEANGEEYMD